MSSLFKTLILAAALTAAPALAHGNMKPQHGGEVAINGETLVELVRGPKGVSIFVSEEDEPIPAAGLSGKLIITEGAHKHEAALRSAAGNRLDAPGLKIASGARVNVSLLTTASQARTNVSLTLK